MATTRNSPHGMDTTGVYALFIGLGDSATANRLVDFRLGDADRIVTLTADVALNQSLRTTDSPTFAAITALTTPLSVANGGTASSTAANARTALGVPGIPVPVASGGTGSTSAADARTALGAQAAITPNTGWSITNDASDKSYDANATTVEELADVLATLLRTLIAQGILGA